MINFSMKDARWANLGIGRPMRTYGCLVTALAMLISKTPDRVLFALSAKDCFTDAGKLDWEKAIRTLGLKSYTKIPGNTPVTKAIIAETNYYAGEGFPQHFYILLPSGQIIDPLTGLQGENKYKDHIVSQRLIT